MIVLARRRPDPVSCRGLADSAPHDARVPGRQGFTPVPHGNRVETLTRRLVDFSCGLVFVDEAAGRRGPVFA
jgi:hypothetical protein